MEAENLQDSVHIHLDSQTLPDDRNEDKRADGGPDLDEHGVGRRAIEGLDPQVLLDPFEEQFDAPAQLVQMRDMQDRKRMVVGKEYIPLARFGVDKPDASKSVWIILRGVHARQNNRLIATQTGTLVHRTGGDDAKLHVAFGSCDKEGATGVDAVQPLEVQVTAIEKIERSGLEDEMVEIGRASCRERVSY